MSLLLFKYCVPSLLGYALFLGISGRLNPLSRPEQAAERSHWLIGLCTGLLATVVMVLGLHMAYSMSTSGVRRLIGPSTWLFLTLTIPAVLACIVYRCTSNKAPGESPRQRMDLALETPLFKPDTHEFQRARSAAAHPLIPGETKSQAEEHTRGVVATFLDTAHLTRVATQESSQPINDESLDQTTSDTHVSEVEFAALATRLEDARKQLSEQTSARQEAEAHLRILRKALYALNQQNTEQNRERIDIHLELEESLAQRIRSEASSVALAASEERQRMEAEDELKATKAKLIHAREILRENSLSRTQALETARKATQLARYSNTARHQLQRQFDRPHLEPDPRHAIVSRLLNTLEARHGNQREAPASDNPVLNQSASTLDSASAETTRQRSKTRSVRKRTRPRLS